MYKIWQAVSRQNPDKRYGYREDVTTYSLSVSDKGYHKSLFGQVSILATDMQIATEFARISRALDGR